MLAKKSCKFCHREGLAILPVRPRIIEDKPDNPLKCKLPESITVPVAATKQTNYVGSVLSSGYLYVYNEQAEEWLDFYATPDSYYYPLIAGASADKVVMNGEAKPCANEPTEQARSAFITLPYFNNLAYNGVFWFAWAKAEWTDAVRKRHEDAGYRAKYMQRFDMKKWVAEQKEDNCYLLEQLKETVVEYQSTKFPKIKWVSDFFNEKNTLLSNPVLQFLFSDKVDAAEAFYSILTDKSPEPLIQEAKNVSGKIKPAIIVLNDPIAIMKDIGKLCDAIPNNEIYLNPKYEREIWLSSTLESIKNSVIEQGKNNERERLKSAIVDLENYERMPPNLGYSDEEYELFLEKFSQQSSLRAWNNNYEKFIDKDQQQAFNETINQLIETLAKDVIEPLINSFHSLIFHSQTVNYFISNFDVENIKSGSAFSQMVISAFLPMLAKKKVLDECVEMLKVKKLEEKHYFVRAYYLNQKKIQEAIEDAFKSGDVDGLLGKPPANLKSPSPDLSGLPWQNVVEVIGKANSIQPGVIIQSMDEIFHALSAPLLPIFSQGLNESIMVRSVALASAIRYATLKPIEITGTYKQIVSVLQQKGIDVMEGQGKTVSRDAKFAAKNALNEAGIKPQGNGKASFKVYLFLDSAEEARIRALPIDKRLDALREGLEILTEGKYVANQKYLAYRNEVFGVKVSGVSSVIQAFTLYKTADAAFKAGKGTETYHRWVGGAYGLAGTVLTGIESAAKVKMLGSLSRLSGTLWMQIPGMIGKGFIGISGAISMYYDMKHVFDEFSNGHYGLAALYGASFLSGGLLTAIGVFGFGGPLLGLAALVIYLVIQLLIAIFTDNDIQKWLQQCLWGKSQDSSLVPFKTLSQEREAFNQLLETKS